MLTTIPPLRFLAGRLTRGGLLGLLAGCAGDDLLLPNDGVPAELRVVSGDEQSAPAGAPIQRPLVVEALDGVGRPVPGAVIVFEFLDSPAGAEVTPATPATDAAGRASAVVKLGLPAGDQRVVARVGDPGSDLSVQFRLTALQPNRGGDGGGDDNDDGDDDGEGGGAGDDGGDGDDGDGDGGDGVGDGSGGRGDGEDDRDDEGKGKDDKGKGGKGKDGKGKDGKGSGGDGDDRDDDDRDDDDRDDDD
jgi:hypothetical protein